MIVLGVDRWNGRWVGIALRDGRFHAAFVADDVAALVEQVDAPDAIGIDIPIGLPESGRREGERLARLEIGRRSSSVFWTPVRRALEAPTHEEANAISRELVGEGISRQSYALRDAILDVRSWMRTSGASPVEVHPEVTFAQMNGGALTRRKKSWSGQAERRVLLEREGIIVPDDIGVAGDAGPDDVLDAAACAWTALRAATGRARSLPDPPENGMAIWV